MGLTEGPLHSRESCEGENAIFAAEDRVKNSWLLGSEHDSQMTRGALGAH